MSLINSSQIISDLDSKGYNYKISNDEINIKHCPHCSPDNNKQSNLYKLYINQKTGAYWCHRCRTKGNWFHSDNDEKNKDNFIFEICKKIWSNSIDPMKDQKGKPLNRYFQNRGLCISQLPSSIRFNKSLEYIEDKKTIGKLPAIVAKVVDELGNLKAIHRTYITVEGKKADIHEVKKVLGSVKGHSVHLAGPTDALAITEGIETGFAFMQATGIPTWSAISAYGMESIIIPESVKIIHIGADKDKSKRGEEAALKLAERLIKEGKQVFVHIPEQNIPENKKSIDWLDVLNNKGCQFVADLIRKQKLFQKSSNCSGISSIPLPLQRELNERISYPLESLGSILCSAVNKLHSSIKAPLPMCAQSVLAAVSLAVQGHKNVIIDGRVYPISEFFLEIGISGERKSAIDKESLREHYKFEKKLIEQYEKEKMQFEIEDLAYKKSKDAILSKAKSMQDRVNALKELGQPPENPLSPILITEEPTYEGLIKLLSCGQPSVGLFSDEGGRMIGGHGMNAENLLKTITGLCEIWDAKRISRVRGGDDFLLLYGRRVSMHLMVQPIVIQKLLSNPFTTEQGFLPRFLICWPESTVGTRKYNPVNLSKDSDMIRYWNRIEEIFNTPFPLAEGKRNELNPASLSLSSESKQLWEKFYNSIEVQLADAKPLAPIRGFGNKVAEHALRIAGILTTFNDLNAFQIEIDTMGAAIKIVQYNLSETLRLYGSIVEDPDIILAEKLLEWAQGQVSKQVYLRQIYQTGPNPIRDKKIALRIVRILVDHNWFISIPDTEIDGSVHKQAWRVNS